MFVTKEDHAEKSKIVLPESEPQPGLLLPSGEINWNCPCLGGMATGPCGVEFREAFSCFHYSEAEPKGSDCYDTFKTMQVTIENLHFFFVMSHLWFCCFKDCMSQYPTVYNQNAGDDDKDSGFSLMDTEEKDDESSLRSQYADGDDEAKSLKEVEIAAK